MLKLFKTTLLTTISFLASVQAFSQASVILGQDGNRVITTGVPFLSITPDARAAAMGDAGAATSPDANSTFWNAAKLPFLETELGVSGSYTPWLSKVVSDMSLSYLSGYKKINEDQVLALSMSYFDLGDIQLTNDRGDYLNLVSPREFTLAGTFAMRLGENISAGLTGRFIHSNLFAGTTSGSGAGNGKPGISAAADISVFYSKEAIVGGKKNNIAFGGVISNIGPKITYLDENEADFLPTNLRLGTAFTTNLDPFNKLTFAFDINKLLVPTPPIYARDDNGVIIREDPNDPNSDPVIARGKDPDRGLLAGMFGSFGDAPDGFNEEIEELMLSFGVEYWYNDLFAVRTGYYYENQDKGDRRYFTAGLGLRYQVFGVDFAYLLPQGTKPGRTHPLQETLRVTLQFNLDRGTQESVTEEGK
ncbi:type IX secretion system outer membrane channel protein PorV [Catalinimonas niigatensis]|uniref:type IX secretion system outer membrane channel protein PorV n=1 Tax=Catalinimonas niigatensis TaxID=1397264 RepID=UPI002666475A|nr:type IX secretion system outer membrane channel protein PorV [Catalinimonas niigatensis]WPP49879.1 type IX secretion system outer membrane channel protein PorV [Catalinimonas niigatensis]